MLVVIRRHEPAAHLSWLILLYLLTVRKVNVPENLRRSRFESIEMKNLKFYFEICYVFILLSEIKINVINSSISSALDSLNETYSAGDELLKKPKKLSNVYLFSWNMDIALCLTCM